MDDLINDRNDATDKVKSAATNLPEYAAKDPAPAVETTDTDRKRTELLRMLDLGEVTQSVNYLKKASN